MGAHCRALQQSPEELLLTIIVPGGELIGSWMAEDDDEGPLVE